LEQDQLSIRGADLERWRIVNGLSKQQAADAVGLQKVKYEEITTPPKSSEVLADPAIAMLLLLYQLYPASSPVQPQPNITDFYEYLELKDSPADRDMFAILIGRSAPTSYRLLLHNGKPGRPVIRWIEAIRRLRMPPKATLKTMSEIASLVGNKNGIHEVLSQGWRKTDDE